MNYNELMKDCVSYINASSAEQLSIEKLGKVYSYKGEYLSWMFQCYYNETLEAYLEYIRKCKKLEIGGGTYYITPEKRNAAECHVRVRFCELESFRIAARGVIHNMGDVGHPIDTSTKNYEKSCSSSFQNFVYEEDGENEEGDAKISLWWHDEDYDCRYMQGDVVYRSNMPKENAEIISVSASKYAVFSVGKYMGEGGLAEEMKHLIHYVYHSWIPKNERRVDLQGYSFECMRNGKAYYCLALLEEEKEEPVDTVYGVDAWTEYINENLFSNLTTESLAKKFHYSGTHFKRVFRHYYNMSVSDYIRKRKLTLIAEEIRGGMDYVEAAEMYGYKTYAGFKKAFEKEFNMSPAVYSKGVFHTVNLAEYYLERKDQLKVSIVNLRNLNMIGHTVFPSKGSDIDIAAQVHYWIGKDFPCLENTRFSCNIEQREDKIALWYAEDDTGDVEYILGPVVKDFTEDVPENMKKVTLAGGKYAIFETEKPSDEDDIAETLRMYTRCVFYGWVKEHREMVDLSRITFERYVNSKIYLYVPLKKDAKW